jgi:hypothetical protein
MNDASMHDMVAELDMLLSSAEIQKAWDEGSPRIDLPNVRFTAQGYRVAMHFHSDRGSLPAKQEIKQSFARIMHRKGAFPTCRIHWLT